MSTTTEDDNEFGFPDKQETKKAGGANPLAGKKKQPSNDQSLLDSISGDQSGSDDDLLKTLEGGGAVGWNPTEAGETLVGDVLKVGSIRSDHPPYEDKPVVTVKSESGTYRVIGYRSVLQREIEESDPQVGDRMAVKFFGPQKIQKGANAGNTTFIYRVAVRRQS